MKKLVALLRLFAQGAFEKTPPGHCPACHAKRWRPAVLDTLPARVCGCCTHVEYLSEAEFYAQFGIMPHTWGW